MINGGRSISKNGRQNTVFVKIAKLKRFFARYDSVTSIGNLSIYGLQKYNLRYGLSVHIKNKGCFKSQLYMQNTILLFRSQILHTVFARFGDITKKGGISIYNLW